MSFWYLHFLPKKRTKTSSKVEFVRSLFGRNVGLKKSFQICLTFSSGCNKNVLKGVQIPCPGPIVHIMKKENMQWVKFFLKNHCYFRTPILRTRYILFNFCTNVLGSSSIWMFLISNICFDFFQLILL